MNALRILIASERYSARLNLKTVLGRHPGWEICGEARTGGEAVSEARKLKPDVTILDIHMPGLSGREATKRIRTVSSHTEILLLSTCSSDHLFQEILSAGARGYILESKCDRDLVVAVKAIANHQPFPASLEEKPTATMAAPLESIRDVGTSRGNRASAQEPGAQAARASLFTTPVLDGLNSESLGSLDSTETERMWREMEETIGLVEQPLQGRLTGLSSDKQDDWNAQDYIAEEFFAIGVRSYELEARGSERVPQLCCAILSKLPRSKYAGLTPGKMARLMSAVAETFPERYTGDLTQSPFLCVTLLASDTENTFDNNCAERLRRCLLRFAAFLSEDAAAPTRSDESESRRKEANLPATSLAVELPDAWLRREPERGVDRILQDQDLASEETWCAEDGFSSPEIGREPQSAGSQTSNRAARALGLFSRVFASVNKVINWLNTPMK